MPECDPASDPTYKLVLVYSAAGFGVVLSFVLAVVFAWKWLELELEYRRKLIPRLCFLILITMFLERSIRLLEIYLKYYTTKFWTLVVYHGNNILLLGLLFCSLFSLLIFKLIGGFQHTSYEISQTEIRLLKSLTICGIFGIYGFFILNGISQVKETLVGQMVMFVTLLMVLIAGFTILAKVDIGFGKRLTQMIVSSHQTRNAKGTIPNGCDVNTKSIAVTMDPTVTDSDTCVSLSDNSLNDSRTRLNRKSSLSRFRSANVESYHAGNQILVRTVAKATVTVLWISLTFMILSTSAVLFSLGICADWFTIIGHILVTLGYSAPKI